MTDRFATPFFQWPPADRMALHHLPLFRFQIFFKTIIDAGGGLFGKKPA